MKFFLSTKPNRNIQRANAATEIAGDVLSLATPATLIPVKIAQGFASIGAIFQKDAKPYERAIHGIQALIATAQIAMLIYAIHANEQCENKEISFCKAMLILDVMYKGILLAGFGSAEIVKEPYHEEARNGV